MPSPEERAKAVIKLRRLESVAVALRRGDHFPITRLTALKSFCRDPKAAARFGLHLTQLSRPKAKKDFACLIDNAILQMEKHLRRRSAGTSEAAWTALADLEAAQSEYRRSRWAHVRTIYSEEALLAEYALRVIVRPWASAHWGYRLAALYAERYDPTYGTGLIPASAPAITDIIAFWSKHYRFKHTTPARANQAGS